MFIWLDGRGKYHSSPKLDSLARIFPQERNVFQFHATLNIRTFGISEPWEDKDISHLLSFFFICIFSEFRSYLMRLFLLQRILYQSIENENHWKTMGALISIILNPGILPRLSGMGLYLKFKLHFRISENLNQYQTKQLIYITDHRNYDIANDSRVHKSIAKMFRVCKQTSEVSVCVEKDHGSLELNHKDL